MIWDDREFRRSQLGSFSEDPRDAIIQVTACAICGSETMGEVVEAGSEQANCVKVMRTL